MIIRPHAAILTMVMTIAVVILCGGKVLAGIGGQESKHNMTDIPGYGFSSDVCAACHKPHHSIGKRLWTSDKEGPADGLRNLDLAKAASLDQGTTDYPGIYLCLDCHSNSAAAPTWSQKPGHAAKKVATHSTKEMQASGYVTRRESFVAQCTTCHDTHEYWNGSFQPGVNGYMIYSVIKTPASGRRAVIFRSMTGAGSLGTDSTPRNSVCEVCHTTTIYHNNTTHSSHNNRTDCTVCHSHASGFAGLSCTACHGNPPVGFSTLVGRPANPVSAPTGAASAGMHAFHTLSTAGGAGYQCRACHRSGMGDGSSQNKVIDIRFAAFGVSTSGSFDGFAPISGYTFSAGNTAGGTLRCGNTYCHGNFTGGISSNKPSWTDSSTGACGTCHATAPPALLNHSVHISAAWGPRAACEDCHPDRSSTGRHSGHVDGAVTFRDGNNLAGTNACDRCHGSGAEAAKASWRTPTDLRETTSWCESCHDGSSTVSTASGTGGVSVRAPDVRGDGLTYGFDVTGHGRPGLTIDCFVCHQTGSSHIDGASPTYSAAIGNYRAGYRLLVSNTVPLLSNYSSGKIRLCYVCHREARLMGMPAGGRASAYHLHTSIISTDQWYTNFRNTSTAAGRLAGNWDSVGAADVPTNIHWNHMDDFGSSRRFSGQMIYDSDRDGFADSHVTCETCHNVHGTRQPAMVMDDFLLMTFSALTNQSVNPSYRWLGSETYATTRCTQACHLSGDASGTAGTKWYREPVSVSTVFGVPVGLSAEPLP
jgi:predicted CxxxxCH...CXXCH cytochrome family protein